MLFFRQTNLAYITPYLRKLNLKNQRFFMQATGTRTKEATAGHIVDTSKIGGEFTKITNGKAQFLKSRGDLFDQLYAKQQLKFAGLNKRDIKISLPDGQVMEGKTWFTTPLAIAERISKGLAQVVIGARVKYHTRDQGIGSQLAQCDEHEEVGHKSDATGWETVDVTRPFEGDCQLELLKFDSEAGKEIFWHSSSHILGLTLENGFGAHLTHGPPLDVGFFYDCYMGTNKITPDDYKAIELMASASAKANHPFERLILTKTEALQLFGENPFKVQLITNKIPEGAETTAYKCGNLIDLCTGPHLPNTGKIKAFKVMKSSSCYWLSNPSGDSLQRVYGVSFPKKDLLDEYVKIQEELAKRDHRNLGIQQKLFNFNPLSPGSAFWSGNGARIYAKLQDFMLNQYKCRGYTNVITPNIYKKALWKTSGHYFKYR